MYRGDIVVCYDGEFAVERQTFQTGEFQAYWGSAPHDIKLKMGGVRVDMKEPGIVCTTAVVKPGVYWWWELLKIPPAVADGGYKSARVLDAMDALGRLRQGGEEPKAVFEGVARTWWTDRTLFLGDTAYQVGASPSPGCRLTDHIAFSLYAHLRNPFPRGRRHAHQRTPVA